MVFSELRYLLYVHLIMHEFNVSIKYIFVENKEIVVVTATDDFGDYFYKSLSVFLVIEMKRY